MSRRFAVTGGRDFNNPALVRLALSYVLSEAVLVHGDATGADTLAARQWEAWERATEAHPADWQKHGRAAGPIRNQEMIDSGIEYLIAFPGGKGTLDMVSRCKKAGIPVCFAVELEAVVGNASA